MALEEDKTEDSGVVSHYHRIAQIEMIDIDGPMKDPVVEARPPAGASRVTVNLRSYLSANHRKQDASHVREDFVVCELTPKENATIQGIVYRALKRDHFPDAADHIEESDVDVSDVIKGVE